MVKSWGWDKWEELVGIIKEAKIIQKCKPFSTATLKERREKKEW